MLTDLEPNTKYSYQVVPVGSESMPVRQDGSFRTLPDPEAFRNDEHNPLGLFNFSFEFGTGNNQNPLRPAPWPPTFKTMLDRIGDKVAFHIQNGDFIYEEKREYTVPEWRERLGLVDEPTPGVLRVAPTLVGVWENYKTYMARGEALAAWHRNVPSFFTFDDHEILDNIEGTGTVGYRDRRAVFRDIGVQGWYDYVGWANPVEPGQIHFGRAQLRAGRDLLTDPEADFVRTALDATEPGDLIVHWSTPLAGIRGRDWRQNPDEGNPNAGVYQIKEVVDANRLRITPAALESGEVSYSIGRRSYFDWRMGNAHLFFVDTRSHRQVGDVERPDRPDRSMLGLKQKAWLMEEMSKSDADIFFVVSQVTLMIPHTAGSASATGFEGPIPPVTHDEAWPVFLAEREELIEFWDGLGKSVIVLTGDLHNSFSIKVTDRVWEFASGPHNSRNHRTDSEGFRPPNGELDSRGRISDIRWSKYFHPDTPGALARQPIYTVVQMNNVFNNPLQPGIERWIAYPHPQVVVQFYDGLTGDLLYAEAVRVVSPRIEAAARAWRVW